MTDQTGLAADHPWNRFAPDPTPARTKRGTGLKVIIGLVVAGVVTVPVVVFLGIDQYHQQRLCRDAAGFEMPAVAPTTPAAKAAYVRKGEQGTEEVMAQMVAETRYVFTNDDLAAGARGVAGDILQAKGVRDRARVSGKLDYQAWQGIRLQMDKHIRQYQRGCGRPETGLHLTDPGGTT